MSSECSIFRKLLITLAVIVPTFSLLQNSEKFNSSLLTGPKVHTYVKNHSRIFRAPQTTNPVERPLFVGSFNIQTLGEKKLKNVDVMIIVEKVNNLN